MNVHSWEEVGREALGVIPNLVTRHTFIVVQIQGTCELNQAENTEIGHRKKHTQKRVSAKNPTAKRSVSQLQRLNYKNKNNYLLSQTRSSVASPHCKILRQETTTNIQFARWQP